MKINDKFLDTNILIRYFTKDDEEKAYNVLELLKKYKEMKKSYNISACNI